MNAMIEQIATLFGTFIPNLLGAIAVLVVGWLIALALSGMLNKALQKTKAGQRLIRWSLGDELAEKTNAEFWISKSVYYILLLFVLVAAFQVLGLTSINQPIENLLNIIFQYIPKVLAAALLVVVAWLVATGLRFVVRRLLDTIKIDEYFKKELETEEETARSLKTSISETIYWLVYLLFLPMILTALDLEGLLSPVEVMVTKILNYLPNIFIALLLLALGWFAARVLQRIVRNLMESVGADQLSERSGLSNLLGDMSLSRVIGLLIYILVFIPIVIAALNALEVEAVTAPASNMLSLILASLPHIFAAAILLILAYVLGRLAAVLITNLLAGVGFDNMLARLGLAEEPKEGELRLSQIAGYLVLVGVMLFSTIEAAELLGFEKFAALIAQFTMLVGQIVLGLVIFAIGLFMANLAAQAIQGSKIAQADLLQLVARISIILLAGAMALRQMGLANEIIHLAFGLTLGAVAVAAALAFGLGGRDVAAREINGWVDSIKSDKPAKGQKSK